MEEKLYPLHRYVVEMIQLVFPTTTIVQTNVVVPDMFPNLIHCAAMIQLEISRYRFIRKLLDVDAPFNKLFCSVPIVPFLTRLAVCPYKIISGNSIVFSISVSYC